MAGVFENKVVMITGAGGGIAAGVLEKAAREGATLALVDHAEERAKQNVEALGDLVGEYAIFAADLGDVEAVDAMVNAIVERFGRIDVLLHTAGGFAAGTPVHETDISVFEKQIFLNARLLFITLGRVARYMVENEIQGSLVAILAKFAERGKGGMAAYAASKAAAQRIVESMADELREHNIRVNGVMPSTADTEPNRKAMPNADYSKWVTPAQIADAMVFLASDAASAISGDSLEVYARA